MPALDSTRANAPRPAVIALPRAGVTSRLLSPTVSCVREWSHEALSDYLDKAMLMEGIRSDAELARLSNVKQTQISNWRRGLNQPRTDLLDRIARALNVPAAALYSLAGRLPEDASVGPVDLTVLPRDLRDLIDLWLDPSLSDDDRETLLINVRTTVRGMRALITAKPLPPARPKRGPERRRQTA